ncbi:MAG: CHAT domain-containing protein [Acidobacteriota bacterium]
MRATAEQNGVDVVLSLDGPAGSRRLEVDGPTGVFETEELIAVVEMSGLHRLAIRWFGGTTDGAVAVTVSVHRPASAEDQALAQLDARFRDAERLIDTGNAAEALGELRALLDELRSMSRLDSPANPSRRLGDVRHALCRAHGELRQADVALAYCRQARDIYRSGGQTLLEAVAARRSGSLELDFGDPREALPDLEAAWSLFEQLRHPFYLAQTEHKIGSAHHHLGTLDRAEVFLERAVAGIARERPASRFMAEVLISSGSLQLALNQPGEALDRYRQARSLYERLGDRAGAARAADREGLAMLFAHDLQRAEAHLEHAYQEMVALNDGGVGNARERSNNRLSLARLEIRRGAFEPAEVHLAAALEISRQAGSPQQQGAILQEMGNRLLRAGEPAAALARLDQASAVLARASDRTGDAMVRIRAAQALRALGDLEAAWSRIEPALDVIDSLRTASDRADVRTDYFAMRQEFFDVATAILMDRHQDEPDEGFQLRALEVHESRRARELLDTISLEPWFECVGPAGTAPLRAEETRLEEQIRRLTFAGEAGEVESQLADLIDQLHAVRGTLDAERLRAAASSAQPLSARAMRDLSDDETAILVYALGNERSTVWAIDGAGVDAQLLPDRASIERMARRYAQVLPRRDVLAVAERERLGRDLASRLLAPVAKALEARRLVVVLTGDLQRVPFATLPHPDPALPSPLLRSHEIVALPSLSALAQIRQRHLGRPPAPNLLAAFADPVFEPEDPRLAATDSSFEATDSSETKRGTRGSLHAAEGETLHRAAQRLGLVSFKRLPGTRAEARAIFDLRHLERTFLAMGTRATRDSFLRGSLGDYRIVHVATHGIQDPSFPELSGLLLSRFDENARPLPGFVYAYEISRLALRAELVVLSACRSARGVDVPGEGVLGLTRAFFEAGAARVLSSLWLVDDTATMRLMTAFYREVLTRGASPAAALRSAQLELLDDERLAAPADWAGFILQGDWRPLRSLED